MRKEQSHVVGSESTGANDAASGEGFAAMALMCVLMEFVQSTDWLRRFGLSM
jgi:hypothetical protein